MNVPVSGKVIYPEDKQALADLILSDADPTYGKYNDLFEVEFAKRVNVRHAHLTNSGSSSNLLAFAAFASHNMYSELRIKPGDEIIAVAASFPTTIAPIMQYKCIPVFVDVDETYNIRPDIFGIRSKEGKIAGKLTSSSIRSRKRGKCSLRRVMQF